MNCKQLDEFIEEAKEMKYSLIIPEVIMKYGCNMGMEDFYAEKFNNFN